MHNKDNSKLSRTRLPNIVRRATQMSFSDIFNQDAACLMPCYHLGKRPNCSHGTCSGLVTWRTRCTTDTLSRTRHIVLTLILTITASAIVLLNGGASPMMPALSMTHASVPVPVPFPQLSPHIRSYCPITPNPCSLGQQVTTCYLVLLFPPCTCDLIALSSES